MLGLNIVRKEWHGEIRLSGKRIMKINVYEK
jgi:hypothetical protein